jgi:hypothetical protein
MYYLLASICISMFPRVDDNESTKIHLLIEKNRQLPQIGDFFDFLYLEAPVNSRQQCTGRCLLRC